MKLTRLIEEYLDRSLGNEEARDLKQRASCDKELQKLIRMHDEVNESIRDKAFASFQTALNRAEMAYFQDAGSATRKPSGNTRSLRAILIMRIAAVLFITAGIGVALKLTVFGGDSPDRIFTKYYLPYDADVISRSAQNKMVALDSAIMQYSQEDYTGALLRINSILERDTADYMAWFYRGLICLETRQTNEAIKSFNTIPGNWNSPYREHHEWYHALALLQQGNQADAAVAFKRISHKGGYYAKKAAKVSRKIKA